MPELSKSQRVVLGAVALIVVLLAVGVWLAIPSAPPLPPPPASVAARDLALAFDRDPESAGQKYSGHPIEVTGIVRDRGHCDFGDFADLEVLPSKVNLRCWLRSGQSVHARVTRGAEASFRGICGKRSEYSVVYVDDCLVLD